MTYGVGQAAKLLLVVGCCCLAMAIVWLCLSQAAQAQIDAEEVTDAATRPEIADTLKTWVQGEMKSRNIPGLAFALVQGGQLVEAGGLGLADIEEGRKVDANSVFRLGSVSKPVTATALLRLVDRGALTLDQDLGPLLEDLSFEPPLEVPLTAHHLLSHSCGLNERLFGQHARTREGFLSLEDYLKKHLPPRFEEPGEVIAYNDYCTALAGLVVERLAGKPFAEAVEGLVFEPLAMTGASFDQLKGQEVARSYAWRNGSYAAYDRDYVMTTPGAGLFASAADMGIYLENLLQGESGPGAILTEASYSKQKAVQFRNHPKLPGRAYGFASMTRKGVTVLYKDGQASGYAARLLMVPETGDGFFIAFNRSILGVGGGPNEAGRLARAMTEEFLKLVLSQKQAVARSEPPSEPQDQDMTGYAGVYRNAVAARHTFERAVGMMDDIVVSSPRSGVISFNGNEYILVSGGLFQWSGGGENYLAFSPGQKPAYLFIGGGTYERVPRWSGSDLLVYGIGSFLIFLAGSLLWGLFMRYRAREWHSAPAVITLSATTKLAFLLGFAAAMALTDPQALFFGPPPWLKLLLGLPVFALILDGYLLLRLPRKPLLILYLAPAFLLAAWLYYWNLLGWHFG